MREFLGAGWLPTALLAAAVALLLAALFLLIQRQRLLSGALARLREEQAQLDAQTEAEKLRMETLLAAQCREREALTERLEQARRERHDFRHQLIVLQQLAQEDRRSTFDAGLSQLTAAGAGDLLSLCDNPLVDALAKYYLRQPELPALDLDIALDVERELWISPLDIGTLFGNLFENAVFAAQSAEEGRRRIRIRSQCTPSRFVMVIGNTYGGELRRDGDAFLSTKANHTGIGLSSVQNVAQKYGGYARFDVEGELFLSSVILFRPEASAEG